MKRAVPILGDMGRKEKRGWQREAKISVGGCMLKSRDIPSLVAQSSIHRESQGYWTHRWYEVVVTMWLWRLLCSRWSLSQTKHVSGLYGAFLFWNTAHKFLIVIINTCYLWSLEIFPLHTFPRTTVQISTTPESSIWQQISFWMLWSDFEEGYIVQRYLPMEYEV